MIKKWGGTFLIALVALGGFSIGLRDTREALANRAPRPVTCSEVAAGMPSGVWVRVTDAASTAFVAAYRTKNDVVEKLFIPLTCSATSETAPVQLVLATDDAELIQLFQTVRGLEGNPQALERFVAANRGRMSVPREITGMVRTAKDEDYRLLEGKVERLASSFVVLEDGAAPSFVRGLAWLAAGFGAVVVAWRVFTASA